MGMMSCMFTTQEQIALKDILDGLRDAVMIVDSDSMILCFNQTLVKLLEISPEELTEKRLSTLFQDETSAAGFMTHVQGELTDGEFSEGRINLRQGPGTFIQVSYRAAPIKAKELNQISFMITVRAVREAGDNRREIQSLAMFSDENPFPMLLISKDGTILYTNRGSWLLLNYWNAGLGQKVPPEWADKVRQTLAEHKSMEIEVQISFMTILLVLVPVTNLECVNIIGLDMTRRKQIERKLLLDSQVFENASEGVIITDEDNRILDVNQAFCNITGYNREEILGENARILQSERHKPDFYDEIWKTIKEKGSWQGEIWDRHKNGRIFPILLSISSVLDESGRIIRYIGLFSDISIMKATEEQLYYMAHYDALTGLPNRRYFQDRLEHDLELMRREKEQLAVLYIDLDGFKLINDNLGHGTGDELLRVTAGRIKECLRDSDTIARMGGDEFTVVLSQLRNSNNAVTVAQNILRKVKEPVKIKDNELTVSASIGIAVFPDDAATAEALLQSADTALYKAKEMGKNGFQFFSQDLNRNALQRLTLQTKMRGGLDQNEFIVYYQPQLNMKTGRLSGIEALVRWQSPQMGMVLPDQFIPLAEETGLISEIGRWVLKSVCELGNRWLGTGLDPIRISVNISAYQLHRIDFIDEVRSIVEASGYSPGNIEFEITENILINDNIETVQKLEMLKKMGINLAIDDFGTKYSSLSYLKRLPIDRLKIDKSFIKDLPADNDSKKIVSTIIAMGSSLNLEIVAEGVETGEQADFLKKIGCMIIQGNYCSVPLTSDDILNFHPEKCK